MVKNSLGILLVSVCLAPLALGLYRQSNTAKAPADADQLVIVRITAALNDAVSRRDKAQLEYEKAVRDIQDLQPELRKMIEAAKAKLPMPSAGMQWVPEPDGQLGVRFVESPVPRSADVEQQKPGQAASGKPSGNAKPVDSGPADPAPTKPGSSNPPTGAAKPR